MSSTSIEIPFWLLRMFIPEDGEVFTHVLSKDKWTQYKDPFYRHETLELALGKKLLAKKEDRAKETWWKPGYQDKGTHVFLRGGWRAHKDLGIYDDFFDGTYTAEMRFTVKQGKLLPHVSKLEFDRNRGALGTIFKSLDIMQFLPEIRAQIAEKVEKEINGYLTGDLQNELKNFFSTDPRLKKLYQTSKLSAKGTKKLYQTSKLSAKGTTLVLKVTEKKS
jgi:hypothetical protein